MLKSKSYVIIRPRYSKFPLVAALPRIIIFAEQRPLWLTKYPTAIVYQMSTVAIHHQPQSIFTESDFYAWKAQAILYIVKIIGARRRFHWEHQAGAAI